MCLAIPGKVIQIIPDPHHPTALVDFEGIQKSVCILMTPEVSLNDYVLVHVGFAIAIINQQAARDSLAELKRLELTHDN